MFLRLEAREALIDPDQVAPARVRFGEAMGKIVGSGKVEASGVFADARGGIFILDVADEMELSGYVFGILDIATVETHPLITGEQLQVFFAAEAAG